MSQHAWLIVLLLGAARIGVAAAEVGPTIDTFIGIGSTAGQQHFEYHPWKNEGWIRPEEFLRSAVGDFVKFRRNVVGRGSATVSVRLAPGDSVRLAKIDPRAEAGLGIKLIVVLASLGFQHAVVNVEGGAAQATELEWLRSRLKGFRFERVDREDATDCFVYEFVNTLNSKERVMIVWTTPVTSHVTRIYNDPFRIVRAERMPSFTGEPDVVEVRQEIEGYMALPVDSVPVIIWLSE